MNVTIKIILASVRPNRFGVYPAAWIVEQMGKVEGVSAELLDLLEYPLPLFAEVEKPARVVGPYRTPEINQWSEAIASADGYVIVTPEYNHGYPASLKNNLDYLAREWEKKPVAFVGYGSVGGARAVEQLRQITIDLGLVPLKSAVHIVNSRDLVAEDGTPVAGAFEKYEKSAAKLCAELAWFARALKTARGA